MLAALPAITLAGITLIVANQMLLISWRQAFLRAAILSGVYIIFTTEILSQFRGITIISLSITWILLLILIAIWFFKRWRTNQRLSWPPFYFPTGWFDRILVIGLITVLGITALVAWLTPPQTWDSLRYHLPRVAHWAQERAVRHFATGMDVQNNLTPGAEMMILHLYVLAGGDRLANFVSWFAMLGSMLGVSWIAKQLGARKSGQLLAAIVTATLPMGIVQATSTMTDYVMAFWLVCVAASTLGFYRDSKRFDELIFNNLAAGLALVTKPTAVVYLIPFAVLTVYILLRRSGLGRTLRWAAVGFTLVLMLNIGHLGRNYVSYGNPISSQDNFDLHANQLLNFQGLISNLLRNAALHTGTPKGAVNDIIYQIIVTIHDFIQVDPNDPRTTSVGPYGSIGGFATHEDVVGNLIHSGLILFITVLMIIKMRQFDIAARIYMLAVITTFILFSLVFKWQIFSTRYHTAFFVLYSPLVGLLISALFKPVTHRIVGLALLVAAIPWLISIDSRPIFPLPHRSTVDSILVESRKTLYFANYRARERQYSTMVNMIQEVDCSTVGIALSGNGAEYPIWVLMGAPRSDLEIEWLVGGTPSERYIKPDFDPCAVICQRCPDTWDTVYDMPMVYKVADLQLYLPVQQDN
jgi:hypothetical protein